ncbi:hypothetical protein [Demequina zhanjiangensis]|uniref:Helicase/secretion neighborhood TadE-like protein n=1 Tax=Demequina zhanjiangensis TaxID=3051659 RepID=A0ABT8G059_9MICO|nr:hypothetical protein [Demequina sp. SYSU T00b26]MDN4472099.1 hypothetical protein [Demequina sp. SYSU T00b26]
MPVVVGLIACAVALAVAVAGLAGQSARGTRAQAIADAAALAGAFAERRDGDGCVVASHLAAANAAVVVVCTAEDRADVQVTVWVGSGALVGTAVARAGPAFSR